MNIFKGMTVISALLLLVALVILIIFTPFAIIWALNTLFPVLAIDYNFMTYLAVVVLNITWLSKGFVDKK